VQGVDYEVDENGEFYRTEEMRMQVANTAYKASHLCDYSYFPNYKGTSRDGINAMWPQDQPKEFYDSLSENV
ncbi:sugar ABC transporter substrate-binding protein, partial [Klebsiella oxytoca]